MYVYVKLFLLHTSACPAKNCHWPASTTKLLPCLSMDKIKDAWIPYSLSQTQKRHPTTLSPQQWSPTGLQITFFFCCADSVMIHSGWLSDSKRAHLAILGGDDDWDSAQLCKTDAGGQGEGAGLEGVTKWRVFLVVFSSMLIQNCHGVVC